MTTLVEALRKKFDTIIIDTPPLLPVTDAAVAAVQADGALLVVRHGKTKRSQVSAAIEALESVDARILGCVVNMAPMRGTDAYLAYDAYDYDGDEPPTTVVLGPSGGGAVRGADVTEAFNGSMTRAEGSADSVDR